LGSRLIQAIIESGLDVIGLDQKFERARTKPFADKSMEVDLRDTEAVKKILLNLNRPIEGIVHLAALKNAGESNSRSESYWESNFHLTIRLIELAEELFVRKFLFASSAAVYAGHPNDLIKETDLCVPNSVYGLSKLSVEEYLHSKKYHSLTTIASLRIFNMLGGDLDDLRIEKQGNLPFRILDSLLNGTELKLFQDTSKSEYGVRDYIDVNEVVRTFTNLMKIENLNIRLNACTGKGTSSLELVEEFERQLQTKIYYLPVKSPYTEAICCIGDPKLFHEVLGNSNLVTIKESIAQMLKEFNL
jgi:UDP-glucose 4-epimerase